MTGDPQPSRLLAPGAGVLLGYVLLVGNPWFNRDIQIAVTGDSTSAVRVFQTMVTYPRWHLDLERYGPFEFWSSNLRTVLFVGLAIAGLVRVQRWLRDSAGAGGAFVATVGTIALSALAAGMASAAIVATLYETPGIIPSSSGNADAGYFAAQLSVSASFGVLLGLVIGTVVAAQRRPVSVARRAERVAQRRVNAPKSFW